MGVTWLVGGAAWSGEKLNYVNFVTLPITFGIGCEYPFNVYDRSRLLGGDVAGGRAARRAAPWRSAATRPSSATASLLFADFQALQSFGRLAVSGEVACLTGALLVLPALLHLIGRRRAYASTEVAAKADARVGAERLTVGSDRQARRSAPRATTSPRAHSSRRSISLADEPVAHVARVDGDARRHERRARASRARHQATVESRRAGERVAQLRTTLGRARPRRRVVDAQVVLGEAVAALAEQRQEPRRHRPGGRDEAVDAEPGGAQDALALLDAARALLRAPRRSSRPRRPRPRAARRASASAARAARRVVALAAPVKEAVQVDLVARGLELAQARAEARVVEQRRPPVEVRHDEQRGPHARRAQSASAASTSSVQAGETS